MLSEIINLKPILAAVDLLEHERNVLDRQVTECDICMMEMRVELG